MFDLISRARILINKKLFCQRESRDQTQRPQSQKGTTDSCVLAGHLFPLLWVFLPTVLSDEWPTTRVRPGRERGGVSTERRSGSNLSSPRRLINGAHRWGLIVLWFTVHVVLAHELQVWVRVWKRDRRKERAARSEVKKEDSKCTPYLALSRPWDLMKFRSLYLDRNATSWLLFLK